MNTPAYSLNIRLCIALLSGALATAASAQAPATPAPPGAAGTGTTGKPPATGSAKAPELSVGDKKFFKDASEGILLEQKLVVLGSKTSTNDTVKKECDKMTGELTKVWERLATLSMSKGAQLAADVAKTDAAKVDRLAKLKPDKFDKEFVKDLGKETKKTAKFFGMAEKTLQDGEVKKFASDWSPTIKGHDEEVDRAQKELLKGKK
jgi:predicted outer membrane protein